MKIKVKESSSIWKLATWWGADGLPSNFCDLTRNVFWCFLVTSLFVVGISTWVACLIATIGASFSVGYIIWSVPLIVFTMIIVVILIALTCAFAENHLRHNPSERLSNIKTAYLSWKDKYCPLIEEIK